MPRVKLTSINDVRLKPFRDLRRVCSERFVVEGRFLVDRLLESDFETESIVISESRADQLPTSTDDKTTIFVLPKSEIDRLVGFRFHRSVLACGRRRNEPSLQSIIRQDEPQIIAICPRLADPVNLGGVIRNCAAFGVRCLLLSQDGADPFSRRSIRVSMGAALKLTMIRPSDLLASVRQLKDSEFELIATVVDRTATPLKSSRRSDRIALLFGEEGLGLPKSWQEICDQRVTLPMRLGIDSLNLATATGVFLYHFAEQAEFRSDHQAG